MNITMQQMIDAIKSGYPVTVQINGEYYDISADDSGREALTDTEQRIFLSAISRERTVCKKTMDECPGGINLVQVCNGIERKVKDVLF